MIERAMVHTNETVAVHGTTSQGGMILNVTSWPGTKIDHWATASSARLFEYLRRAVEVTVPPLVLLAQGALFVSLQWVFEWCMWVA